MRNVRSVVLIVPLFALLAASVSWAQPTPGPLPGSRALGGVKLPAVQLSLQPEAQFSALLKAQNMPEATMQKDLAAFKALPLPVQEELVRQIEPADKVQRQDPGVRVLKPSPWARIDPERIQLLLRPVLSSVSPPDGAKGEYGLAIGDNFRSTSKVFLNNVELSTTPISFWGDASPRFLSFQLPTTGVTVGATYPIQVRTGTIASGNVDFQIVSPRGYRGKWGWKVANRGGPTIPWAIYRNYFGASAVEFADGSHRPAAQSWYDSRYKGIGGGGNCYGMSLSSLRVKHDNLTGLLHRAWFIANPKRWVWDYDTNRNLDEVWQTVMEMQGNQLSEPQHTLLWDRINNQTANQAWEFARDHVDLPEPHGVVMGITGGGGHAVVVYDVGPDQASRQFMLYDNNTPYAITETGGPDKSIATTNKTANTFSYGSYNRVGTYDLPELLVAPNLPTEAGGPGMGAAANSSYLSVTPPARVAQISDPQGNTYYVGGNENTGANRIPGVIRTFPLGNPPAPDYPETWLLMNSRGRDYTIEIDNPTRAATTINFTQKGLVTDLVATGAQIRLASSAVNTNQPVLRLLNPSAMNLQALKLIGITGPAEERTFDIRGLQGAGAEPVEVGLETGNSALRMVNRGGAALNAQVRLSVDAPNLHSATGLVGLSIEPAQTGVLRPGNWRNIQGQSLQLDRLNLTGARLRTDQIRP